MKQKCGWLLTAKGGGGRGSREKTNLLTVVDGFSTREGGKKKRKLFMVVDVGLVW